jgi:hypothetical protein
MNYNLLKDTIKLLEEFETEMQVENEYTTDIEGFKNFIIDNTKEKRANKEPDWEGKENGRSPESVINTLTIHLNRYAKTYSKSAIHNSDFSTQEDFIYLINLKAFGAMAKMELVKKNIHEKPVGMQIINRLISQGWVEQHDSKIDKRSKIISITTEGLISLEKQMQKIRKASQIVTANLSHHEKMQLIELLQKLTNFHQPIYNQNIDAAHLLDRAYENYLESVNSLF